MSRVEPPRIHVEISQAALNDVDARELLEGVGRLTRNGHIAYHFRPDDGNGGRRPVSSAFVEKAEATPFRLQDRVPIAAYVGTKR